MPRLKLQAALLLGIAALRCSSPRQDDSLHPLTELVPPNVVVLFKNDTGRNEINSFLDSAISIADPRGGHAHRPGVGGIRVTRVGTHEGYVVSWTGTATAAERKDVRRRIDADPIVCKVFEDIEPSAIDPSLVACP